MNDQEHLILKVDLLVKHFSISGPLTKYLKLGKVNFVTKQPFALTYAMVMAPIHSSCV
jgi:hypothetical protein